MNISGDGHNDGKFKIQSGQGLSQAIAGELGLSKAQCKQMGVSVWAEVMAKAQEQNNENKANNLNAVYSGGDDINGKINSNFVIHENQEISFSQKIWNEIIAIVNKALGKEIEPVNSEAAAPQPTAGADGQKELTDTLSSDEFKETLKTTIPNEQYRAAALQYLDPANRKIVFKEENNPGAARYDSENGIIIVNTKNKTNNDDLVKLLVHESMHAAQNSRFNTQDEELLCEMTAIKTRAELIKAGQSADGEIYGKKYSELGAMSDTELREHLMKNFIGDQTEGHFGVGPYSNRIINSSGAVTIHDASGKKVPLAAGDKINIAGKDYTLGKDIFIEGIGAFAGSTCQVFQINAEGKPQTIGILSFDNLTPLPMEGMVPQVQEHNSALASNQYQTGSAQTNGQNFSFKITGYSGQ